MSTRATERESQSYCSHLQAFHIKTSPISPRMKEALFLTKDISFAFIHYLIHLPMQPAILCPPNPTSQSMLNVCFSSNELIDHVCMLTKQRNAQKAKAQAPKKSNLVSDALNDLAASQKKMLVHGK
jgi:hypothetical protein